MTEPKIVLSKFCLDHDQRACRVPLPEIVAEVTANFHLAKPGYRDGVLLVPVEPSRFLGQIVVLREGELLIGSYRKRAAGELPRKDVRSAELRRTEPVAVDIVLYHRDVLAEGGENSDMSADYEIIKVITKVITEDQPMPPETLMANNFLDSGGTATHMSDSEFVAALRKSYFFWRDKATLSV